MAWDYERYAAVKMGLAQPPSWREWQSMEWRTAKRWLKFENENRRLEKERQMDSMSKSF